MEYSTEYKEIINSSIDSCYFLLSKESSANYIKLIDLFESIIMSSKLDDHPNIYILVEKAKFLLESLINAHNITDETWALLKECLDKLKSNITNDDHSLDLHLTERIENSVDNVKRNERDFAFFKKIKTLFICDDNFLKESVLKKNDGSVEFTHSKSFNESFEIMENEKFDVVLCDVIRFNTIIEDFLATYSKRYPIVVIYNDNDPKMISKIAKTDAMNMIPRMGLAITFLAKTLHTSYSDWRKQKQKSFIKPLLENPQIKIILHDMLLAGLPIQQKLRSHLTNEIIMNPVIKESYNIQVNDIMKTNSKIIDTLVREKYLIKEDGKNIITCPNCEGADIDTNYLCEHCGHESFAKYDNVVIHKACGQASFKNQFKIGNNFYCPWCKTKVDFTSDCYDKKAYLCKRCTKFFYAPKINYKCNYCNYGPFTMIEGKLKILYAYKINPLFEKQFKQSFFVLEKLNQYLIEEGFTMSYNEYLSKGSDDEISADLIARKYNKTIIVVILSSHLEYNIEMIHYLEMAKRDSNSVTPLIISLEEPNQILINIISKFGIHLIVSENNEDIYNKTREYLNRKQV